MKFRQIYDSAGKVRYRLDHTEVTKEEFDRVFAEGKAQLPQVPDDPEYQGNRPWARAIASDALAVHPEQIPEVMERNKKHGLEVEYESEFGRPLLQDRDQRRRLMRIENVHDKNGGYGDG